MLKKVTFPLGFRGRKVFAGPYKKGFQIKSKMGYKLIKLAKEISLPCDYDVPIADFSIPDKEDLIPVVRAAICELAFGRSVFVGCWGGIGRTGLFLAVLAKALGVEPPISWVRMNYISNAVETQEQMKFVNELKFDAEFLRFVKVQKFIAKLLFWK